MLKVVLTNGQFRYVTSHCAMSRTFRIRKISLLKAINPKIKSNSVRSVVGTTNLSVIFLLRVSISLYHIQLQRVTYKVYILKVCTKKH